MTDNSDDDIPDAQNFTDLSPNPDNDSDLAILGDALQEHGVTRVIAHYDGSGDSGCIEEVEYLPVEITLPRWLQDGLRDVVEGYCPQGYADGDGGYGTLTIHPCVGLAQREHCDRYEDSETMETAAARLPRGLRQRLARLDITSITAQFDGYGDSGCLEEPTIEPPSVVLDEALRGELEELLLGLLPGGWEINEGSFGDFTIDVAAGQVTVDASWRVARESETQITRWRWRS